MARWFVTGLVAGMVLSAPVVAAVPPRAGASVGGRPAGCVRHLAIVPAARVPPDVRAWAHGERVVGHLGIWTTTSVISRPAVRAPDGSYSLRKFAWYLEPAFGDTPIITGRRVDGAGIFQVRANNAYSDGSWWAVSTLHFSTPGCWAITGRYRASQLTIRVWVPPLSTTATLPSSTDLRTGASAVARRPASVPRPGPEISRTRVSLTSVGPPTVGMVTSLPVGALTDVVYGYGSLWVPGNGVVRRADSTTGRVIHEFPVAGSSDYRYLALGAGAVWVVDSGTEQLTRIDPRTNRVTATIALAASPTAIVVAKGAVWITYLSRRGSGVLVVDPHANAVLHRTELTRQPNTIDISLTVGDGHVWASDRADVYRDDGHRRLVAAFALPGRTGADLSAAGNQTLWFLGDGIIRIDTRGLGHASFVPQPRVTPFPAAAHLVVTTPAVWVVTNPNDVTGGRPGQLWELDPSTLTLVRSPITVGETAVRLFVTGAAVYVANYTDASITRVALQPR